MNKKQKPNIIWIIVDAVRNYPSNDKYGKLDVMQDFIRRIIANNLL